MQSAKCKIDGQIHLDRKNERGQGSHAIKTKPNLPACHTTHILQFAFCNLHFPYSAPRSGERGYGMVWHLKTMPNFWRRGDFGCVGLPMTREP